MYQVGETYLDQMGNPIVIVGRIPADKVPHVFTVVGLFGACCIRLYTEEGRYNMTPSSFDLTPLESEG